MDRKKTKMNQIIQAAVHAFAQADIMHGRMPDYDDYGIIGFDLWKVDMI